MITDISKYIDFLCDLGISEGQFLILWLIHTKDKVSITKYKNCKGEFSIHDIEYLIDRDYINDFGIIKDGKRDYNIYDFLVTDKFSKVVIIDEEDAYQELCAVYPPWMTVKGTKWPMIKGDPYKIGKEYYKCYKGNRLAHNRIVDITKRYFSNHLVQGNIEDYILNRRWNLLESEVRDISDSFKTM